MTAGSPRPLVWRARIQAIGLGLFLARSLAAVPANASFVTFETGQVRPLVLSADGSRLFAVNTPDDRLEIFAVSGSGLTHLASLPVGLEPVAVAARNASEVWVVNHLSDSVSIVDVASSPPRVTRTLLVGDEPRDIVFAGPSGSRAFISTAHRGQNRPSDPQLTTPGIGRADVWVFDAMSLGAALGGTPLTIVTPPEARDPEELFESFSRLGAPAVYTPAACEDIARDVAAIPRLKRERNAVVLAHSDQRPRFSRSPTSSATRSSWLARRPPSRPM